jgi:hypothetical protein
MKNIKISQGLASIAVCGLGAYCMYLTNGNTGVGWSILGLIFIWEGY